MFVWYLLSDDDDDEDDVFMSLFIIHDFLL